MRLIFFFLVFSIGFVCFGQTHLQGKVVNSETALGVPFATVTYKNEKGHRVIYTDSVGKFSIKNALSGIKISCVGYETISYGIKNGNDDITIKLLPVSVQLQSVVINAKPKKRIRLGYFKDQELTGPVGFGNYVGPSGERANYVAQFVPNKTGDSALLITKLLYNLLNDVTLVNRSKLTLATNCTTNRLRVHLFTRDKKKGCPDVELLTRNIVFKNDCSINNLIIDISNENIYLPKDGVFVGLEYVDDLKTSNRSFPYYIVFNSPNNSCYFSYHQQNWGQYQYSYKQKIGARFGIEVIR